MALASITFVTSNVNKLKEVKSILNGSFDVVNESIDVTEIQGSIEEVARSKCKAAYDLLQRPVITEDTCLCFDAFGGHLPGPYIKWFQKDLGPEGVYKMLDGFADKNASAICTFAYCDSPDAPPVVFQGQRRGVIVSPRGEQSFNWDCIFQPNGYIQTYAEMDKELKNSISHRSIALRKVVDHIKSKL